MSTRGKRRARRVALLVAGSLLGLSCPLWPARLKPTCEAAGHVAHVVFGLADDGCSDD